MRKLQQSLKLLFKNGRSSVSLPAEGGASASAHLFRSSSSAAAAAAAKPHPLSRLVVDTFRSWRSGNGITTGSSSVLGFRTISNQMMARTHAQIGLQGLLDRGASLLKISLQRNRFDDGRFLFSRRSFWSYARLTPDGVVYGLIGANVAVYVLWRIADPTFMRKHFMISLDNVKSGRLHTLLTSAFSHADAEHLITNMIGLYFFGTSIAGLFGPEFLIKLYIAGALGGSLFYLAHMSLTSRSSKGKHGWDYSRTPALGASAAVNSIILLNVFLFPKNIIYLNLIVPVPAMLMGAILIGSDLWRIKKGDEHVSGSAHLGGAVVAAIVCARIKGWI